MSETSHATLSALWEPFQFFLGHWQGTGEGGPGTSRLSRTYTLILQNQFLKFQHRSEYPPQEQNPNGEIHEELGFFSFDTQRKKYLLREFHVEGFVNQYVLQGEPGGPKFEFISEAIENFRPGWRARTTCQVLSANEFQETFDLAGPSQPWSRLVTNTFTRKI